MQYGVSLPNFDAHWHPRTLARLAQEAEEAGWDGFFVWDHILFDPYGGIAMSDPWVALAAMAMSTRRIRLGTMITPLPRRRPWKVAREVVSVDHLSDGRLILGVGLGDPAREEYEWLGEESDPKVRAGKLDESLAVMTGLWSGEKFSFEGEHFRVKETIFLPRPLQSPCVPIWVGGVWPNKAPFRRAARWDGVVPIKFDEPISPEMLREIVGFTREQRTSQTPFDVVYIGQTPGDDREQGGEIARSYAEAGATWWVEDLAMWRFRPWRPWEEPYVWPVEEIEARLRQGPPRGE